MQFFKLVARNSLRNRLRSALTVAGIVAAVTLPVMHRRLLPGELGSWLWRGALVGLALVFVLSLRQVLGGAPRAELFTNAIVLADIVVMLLVRLVAVGQAALQVAGQRCPQPLLARAQHLLHDGIQGRQLPQGGAALGDGMAHLGPQGQQPRVHLPLQLQVAGAVGTKVCIGFGVGQRHGGVVGPCAQGLGGCSPGCLKLLVSHFPASEPGGNTRRTRKCMTAIKTP